MLRSYPSPNLKVKNSRFGKDVSHLLSSSSMNLLKPTSFLGDWIVSMEFGCSRGIGGSWRKIELAKLKSLTFLPKSSRAFS